MLLCPSGVCFVTVLKVRKSQNEIIGDAAEIGTRQLPFAVQKHYRLSQYVWLDQSILINKQGIKF